MVKEEYNPIFPDSVLNWLPLDISLLEVGMGPGLDYDRLKSHYKITGSDYSRIFLDEYKKNHPHVELLELDLFQLGFLPSFEVIISNKVLSHFSLEELTEIFSGLKKRLNPPGWMIHSFWKGQAMESFQGLKFYYYQPDEITSLLERSYKLIHKEIYTEMERDDSFYIVI